MAPEAHLHLVNLTPHEIVLRVGADTIVVPESGRVVRQRARLGELVVTPTDLGEVLLTDEVVGETDHLPRPSPHTLLIVSRAVATAHPERDDLVVPVLQERQHDGSTSAGALARLRPEHTLAGDSGTLVVLCGMNPLPNLLAVVTRRPRRAVLLHSPETRPSAVRLRAGVRSLFADCQVELRDVASSTDGTTIRTALAELPAGWGLDYTGGTKAMAALARLACASPTDPADSRCSYIDHRADLVRFDDGTTLPLDGPGLTLESLALLHGSTLTRDPQRFRPDRSWITSTGIALVKAARDSDAAERKQRYSAELQQRVRALPATSWGDEIRARPGLWLEWYVHQLVVEALGDRLPPTDVCVGATLRPSGADDAAELDVVVRQDWLVTLFSCDTSIVARWSAHHKSKAMEAVFRSRQLGGDASHPALVTLLTRDGTEGVARHLGANQVGVAPRVFGADDLHRWADGDLDDLRIFLIGK